MQEFTENLRENQDPLKPVADTLFSYLHDIIYKPSNAALDIESLPESFADFGKGLQYLCGCISETRVLAKELAAGNLDCQPPPPANEIASPLKMLHSSLKHLTWQTQQVAKGDYNQRVSFMGDFSEAFNNMVEQLEQRRKIILDEKTKLELYVQLILLNCPNPILLFDSRGKLAYVSDSFFQSCHIFERDGILGKTIHDLFAPIVSEKSLDEIEQLYNSSIAEEHMFETEQNINFGNSKSWSHFKIQITPMLDRDGIMVGRLLFLFDMTESIKARREAEHARELAEQSSRSKSNFLARMSHEIRTPMNAILGMAELALREDVPPTAEEHIRTIKQAGLNLLSIINDILDFSKIEAGKLEIVPAEYLFSSLVNDVINIIRIKIFESRLRFVVNIDSNIPNLLFGDAIRIRQILVNLLSNAVKYTERGSVALLVSGETTDDNTVTLTVEVTDSGKGIRQEEKEKLFSVFTRFDLESNKAIEGTGLGLAITHSLVTAMNGKIDVQSEYGKGSTFTVTLPQRIIQSQKMAVVEDPEKKKVLVYERRDIYADSIVQTLDNLGVNYKLASEASDFFNCLESKEYSFVFLPSTLYEDVKKKHLNYGSDVKFAVIVEFGEAITDRNISILTVPIFSIPVANFLNCVSDNYIGSSRKEAVARFEAPEAKVLVVDDINMNLEVAEGLLLPYKMQISLCKSGVEAIKEVELTRFDLVFMDQMMPGMDGIETVSNIRALGDDPYYKNVPIVALTADAVFGTKEMLIKNGFNDFLSKPIDTAKLNAILEKWIPAKKQKTPVKSSPKDIPDGHGADGHSANGHGTEGQDVTNEIKIAGVNVKRGVSLTGGNTKSYRKILSIFHRDGLVKIKEIKACLEAGNLPLYVTYVHALKSSTAIIGADSLSEVAKALESAGKQADLAFIEANNDALLTGLETLLHDIGVELSKETDNGQKNFVDKEVLKTELSRLKTALNAFDLAEINKAVRSLQEFTQAADIGGSIEAILQKKLIGEYDEAVTMIDTLMSKVLI